MAFQKPSHTFTKIHLKGLRTNRLHILFALSFTVFINTFSFAQELPKKNVSIPAEHSTDSTAIDVDAIAIDSILKPPLNIKEIDSTKKDSTKKKGLLAAIVNYKATDYVALNQRKKEIYLYNEAEVIYQDMEIKAGIIVIDYSKNLVYAGRIKDSTGYTQRPVFKQGQNVIEPDSIVFNTETKKALVFNSRTEQMGFKVYSPITKKENDSVYFMKNGKFTTAEDEEDPEYQFVTSKMKLVPNKKVIVGPTYMEIYGIPTPIALPFAFFPMTKKQTSGIIFPSFGEDNDRGYNLQNGGYYFAISDYLDLAVLGDYYTNGSYGLRIENSYAVRYKYRGNVSFRYENLLSSERGFPDFSQSTVYNIRWSHSQDAKANPNSRFSASVNLGSSTYFQESINQLNQSNFLNNTLASSVSYSKTFSGEPQVNVSLTASHRQNTNTGDIDVTLPTLQMSMGRIYPFAPKTGAKKGAIHNINFQLNTRGEYSIQTNDSIFGKSEMFDDAKVGMRHSIPITTNFKVFDHFSVSTNANFEESWTLKTVKKFYDQTEQQEVLIDQNGFDRFLTYNFGASVGTTIYGMYNFEEKGENKKIKAIRHVMRPSISYTVNPKFDQYYETYDVIDADNNTILDQVEYTRFENSLYGRPGNVYSSSVGLALGNNLEAKIRSKDSTKTEPEKIFILNNLNFSTSYNIAADSLKWSPVRVSGGTQILNKKMSINFGMTLNPYALNSNNNVINTYNINNGGSLFRLTSANINMSYTLSNDSFSGRASEEDKASFEESTRSGGRADDLFGKAQDFADRRLSDSDKNLDNEEENNEFYNYKMPWSLRLAYAANYGNTRRENQISSHSLMFSGDVDLSPRWSVGASSGYDFLNQGFTYTQLRFERDLLSWKMNFSWIPFSERTSWNFFIGIKSSLLKDLKYDQRKRPDQRVGN
ncbi:putative LPS assembly protein LptD [Winogradskyella bathintestinalis]|uniref:LPS assembly protein LptD n=1 Tax=Winogradskyella bathintestinalis TaxID=3035208 RepID=A0ABT7ZVT8_9FLAO|nr:putative LPS assembly protein LptD [Winogradskyella bathintestinalis]MDN3493141.1 putative LPS assembly protein LptD [Winogradskyella bathintestinalis]